MGAKYKPISELTDREWNLHRALGHLDKAEAIMSGMRDDDQGYWDRMCQQLRDVMLMVKDDLETSQ